MKALPVAPATTVVSGTTYAECGYASIQSASNATIAAQAGAAQTSQLNNGVVSATTVASPQTSATSPASPVFYLALIALIGGGLLFVV